MYLRLFSIPVCWEWSGNEHGHTNICMVLLRRKTMLDHRGVNGNKPCDSSKLELGLPLICIVILLALEGKDQERLREIIHLPRHSYLHVCL